MKELTIEEKARRYDEALERARKEYKNHEAFKGYCEMLEHIFTELKEKESEDEKIRKWLITQLELKSDVNNPHDLELMILKSIAWLEKQGEQKPITIDIDKMVSKYSHTKDGDFGLPVNCQIRAYRQGINDALNLSLGIKKQGEQKPYGQREECLDCQFNYAGECKGSCAMKRCEQKPDDNVEPKFKVGDWVVYCGDTYQITGLNNNIFTLTGCDGSYFFNLVESTHEPSFHLWTIQDAKDGDVLYLQHDGKEHIIIYKGVIKERFRTFISAYCAYNSIVDAFCFADVSRYTDIAYGGITPATKEQRDLLLTKMKEAGYEWDAKEKQLMKVPRKVQATGVLKQLIDEQKSVDVEELDFFDDFRNSDVKVDSNEDGLIAATIKYKNEQKPAWSEDDENMLRRVFDSLNTYAKNAYPCLKSVVEEEIDWLKSIKERTKGE